MTLKDRAFLVGSLKVAWTYIHVHTHIQPHDQAHTKPQEYTHTNTQALHKQTLHPHNIQHQGSRTCMQPPCFKTHITTQILSQASRETDIQGKASKQEFKQEHKARSHIHQAQS